MPCKVCGFTNPAGAIACQACGTTLIEVDSPRARVGDAVCATHKERPAVAPCDRCGTFYCGQCLMRGSDGKLLCEPCRSRAVALPWDRRAELGTVRAWWQTSVLLLQAPQVTLAQAQRDAPFGSSILFAMLSTVAGFFTTFAIYAVGLIVAFVVAATQADKLEGGAGAAAGASVAIGFGVIIFYAFAIVCAQLASLFILPAIQHVVLRLLGEREISAYSVTVRAHALGLAPYVLGLIPFCGVAVMGMWALVLQCLTLTNLQKVSGGKAVIAVLSPMFVICLCLGGVYALVLLSVISTMGLSG